MSLAARIKNIDGGDVGPFEYVSVIYTVVPFDFQDSYGHRLHHQGSGSRLNIHIII